MKFLILVLKGIVYGVTNLLPGIGGGLILIILGIYEQFVSAMGNLFVDLRNWRKNLSFLVPMGIGAAIGMVAFAKGVESIMARFPVPSMFFFMGLVIGTIPSVLHMHGDMRFNWKRGLALLIGVVVVVLFKYAERRSIEAGLTASADTVGGFVYYLLANVAGGAASVTPGMDGSYIWMLTGIFEQVMAAIGSVTGLKDALSANTGGLGTALASVHWAVLLATGIGAVIGIMGFSKLIDIAIRRIPAVTYYAVLGLVVASVYGLWPSSEGLGEGASSAFWPAGVSIGALDVIIALVAFAVGAAITLLFGSRERKTTPPDPTTEAAQPPA